jgi:phosphate transport system protein
VDSPPRVANLTVRRAGGSRARADRGTILDTQDLVQTTRHTDQQFRAQLQELKDRLLAMGGRCERLIASALQAIEEGDGELASEVQSADRLINADELAVDDLAVRILALRQPVGRDLRFLVCALKVVVALERIGDEAVNVSERAPLIAPRVEGLEDARRLLPVMGRKGSEMLKRALDSFVAESADQADAVLAMDDEVDRLYEQVVALATRFMSEHPDQAKVGLGVARTAKYFERIADLCTNVAEMVVYMDQGVDVRHGGYRRRRKS